MESSGKLMPQLKSENTSKYAAKLAKFEEFRQQREREKQERLARIERRKQELRDHRVTEIQKSLSGLQLKPRVDNAKQPTVDKSQPPASSLSTDAKPCVTRLTCGLSGSVMKKVSASKEVGRRVTIATRGLPSTGKKLVSERVRPRILSHVKDENVGAIQEGSAGAKRAVKRHLLLSGTDVAKKPCLEPRNTNVRHESLQMKNTDKKLRKENFHSETGVVKPKNHSNQLTHAAVQPKTENNHCFNDNGKRLTREQELELWRQKKLQQTTGMKSKFHTQSRRETLPATRPGLTVFSTAVKSAAVQRTSSATQQVRAEMAKKKRETISSVHVRSKIDSIRARPVQLSQKNPNQTGTRVAATVGKSLIRVIPGKNRTVQKSGSVLAGKPDNSRKDGSGVRDKTLLLSTVFSASEPATPELKGPRMSTPYSTKRVGSPCDLLQISSIAGSRMKGLTNTWTPKTPKTPRSTLSMRLEKWLAAHGKTPSRYRHLACYGVHAPDMSTPQPSSRHCAQKLKPLFENDDKKDSDIPEQMQRIEKELITMFTQATSLVYMGFPTEHLTEWLNDIIPRIPDVKQLSYYWSCKAHLAAAAPGRDGAAEAMQILEEGARNGAKPEEELEKAKIRISEYLGRSLAHPSNVTYSAHKRLANEVQQENIFDSSSVKFSLKKIPNLQPNFVTPQKVVVTPVRRSTRRSCARLPAGLRDHDTIVESVDEIPAETQPLALFQSNIALNLQWRFQEPDVVE